jgi:putative DNA primase/helicase
VPLSVATPIGHRAFDELERVDRERPIIHDAASFLNLELPPRELLLDPVLPAKGLAMLYAPRGMGKTFVALGLAYAVASGGQFWTWKAAAPRRVLYVDGEMPAQALQDRLKSIIAGNIADASPANLQFLAADLQAEPLPDLADPSNQTWLESVWGERPDLLILDNLSALTGSVRDNDADSWTAMQRWLLSLRRRGTSCLFVHHAGKGGQQRGTSRREDILDTVISLRKPANYSPKEGARFEVHLEKARGLFGEAAEPFEAALTMEGSAACWSWKPLEDARLHAAAALFRDGYKVRSVAEELKISTGAAGRLRKKAIEAGLFDGHKVTDAED